MNNDNNIAPINEDLNVVKYEQENIKNMIYTIRGKQVILDSDIARLYEVETKKLNQSVKRNKERFPEEFCFQLSNIEMKNLRSQFVTSSLNKNNYGGRRYLPYAFTEQGVAMLSAILHSDKAIKVSINIINAFIEMRKFILNNQMLFEKISNNDKVNVEIYTKSNTKLTEKDINNFNQQYSKLEVKYTNIFHDRFLILDRKNIYHIGASIKDLGKKCFGITLIKYDAIIKDIIGKL